MITNQPLNIVNFGRGYLCNRNLKQQEVS